MYFSSVRSQKKPWVEIITSRNTKVAYTTSTQFYMFFVIYMARTTITSLNIDTLLIMDNTYILTEVDNSENIECILTMNIRSINHNFDHFIAYMASLDLDLDIFVLAECWTNQIRPPPNLDKFSMFWTKKK